MLPYARCRMQHEQPIQKAATPPSPRKRPWRRRVGFLLVLALALTPLYIFSYNRFAQKRLLAEYEAGDRDPATGVLRGAEALTLPGEGREAVLMLHGYLGTRQDFNGLGEALQARGMTVRYLRFPGHGTRAEDFANVSPDQILQHARDEFFALSASHDKVHLVGFSMGATVTTLLASELGRLPGAQLGDVVLISPYFGVTHQWFYLLRPEQWQAVGRSLFPYVVRNEFFIKVNRRAAVPNIIAYRVIPSTGIDTLMELGRRARLPDTLAGIRAPVLILHSQGDEAADPQASLSAYSAMTGTSDKTYESYQDSNHILLWDYDADAAQTRILQFLSPK